MVGRTEWVDTEMFAFIEAIQDREVHLQAVPPIEETDAAVVERAEPTDFDEADIVIDLRGADPVINLRQLEDWLGDRTGGLLHASRWGLATKRAMDITIGSLFLLISLPVFFIASFAIVVTSPGPVFYRQTRIGKYGEPFTFLKFRSMRAGAHEQRADLSDQNEVSGPVFKIREDPRITPVGRVLRKLSIDELPQVFHVLSGKMSLVGARPPLPDEVDTYGSREWLRLLARPGLTCIWQTSGRSDLDFDTWVDMDIDYILNWNLGLDVKLLFKTVPAVLSGRGAY